MGSLSKPRCARGRSCYHVLRLHSEEPPTVGREGELCGKCQDEHTGGYASQGAGQWIDEVVRTIEAVLAERTGTEPTGGTSLWDLFELDPHNGGVGKRPDRGECLSRLNAKTLTNLRDWLEANEEEAVRKGYNHNRFKGLWAQVSLLPRLEHLLPGKSLFSGELDPTLPLEAVAYTRSGRAIDLTTIIKLARLRRKPGFMSERDLAKEVGIPRSTVRHIIERMEEIGFSLDKYTSEELEYVAAGTKRGPKHKA